MARRPRIAQMFDAKAMILRDREHRRHRVDREGDVGRLDDDQRDEQRRGRAPAVLDRQEARAVEPRRDGQEPREKAQERVLRRLEFLLFAREELESREDEEHAHRKQHPVELDQHAANADEEGAEHDRAHDSPEEDAVLLRVVKPEEPEDHEEDEQVVDRERDLDEISGQELEQERLRRLGRGEFRVARALEKRGIRREFGRRECAERKGGADRGDDAETRPRKGDEEAAPFRGAVRSVAGDALDHEEVEREQQDHGRDESSEERPVGKR
jgi:hypothetical protein